MKSRAYLAGLVLTMAAMAARAELSVTPAVVSDYDFRGYSQSGKGPALQVGVDYATGPFHVGAWVSNVDFGPHDARTEVDLLADFSFGSEETVAFNAGAVYYLYPGHDEWSYPEIWLTASRGWFAVGYYYGWAWPVVDSGHRVEKLDGNYLQGSVAVPIGETGFEVTAHAGYSFGQFWTDSEYTDWSVGVGTSLGHFDVALKYVGSDQVETRDDLFNNEDRVILSVSTTLPWSRE
ncbi:MAG: hypothetical protein IT480_05445 [Gammaproteobacteria bacterium]|nr:hypothetical protein [Gammaproteobacteria bacterium]